MKDKNDLFQGRVNRRSQLRHCTTEPSRFSTKLAQDLISSSLLLPPLPKFRLKLSPFDLVLHWAKQPHSLSQIPVGQCQGRGHGSSPGRALLEKPSEKKPAKQLCFWGEAVAAVGQVHSHSGKFNAHFLLVKGYSLSGSYHVSGCL